MSLAQRILLFMVLTATIVPMPVLAQQVSVVDAPAAAFAEANAEFEVGHYEEAIAIYEKLVGAGAVNADLYYNLANAHYKLGTLGYAVLNYERAIRLAPRDEDIRQNLKLITSLLGDRQFVAEQGIAKRLLTWWHRNLNSRESTLLASAMYLLLTLSVMLMIFRRSSSVTAIYGKLSLISPGRLMGLEKVQDMAMAVCTLLVLTSVTGTSAAVKYRVDTARTRAVIIAEEVPVYSGPSSTATLQFNIHHGTTVKLVESRPGWAEIELPGSLSGWIELGTVERI